MENDEARPRGRALGVAGLILMIGSVAPWVVLWADEPVMGERFSLGHSWDMVDTSLLGGAVPYLQWIPVGVAWVVGVVWVAQRRSSSAQNAIVLIASVLAFLGAGASLAALVAEILDDEAREFVSYFSITVLPGPGAILPVVGSLLLAVAALRRRGGAAGASAPALPPPTSTILRAAPEPAPGHFGVDPRPSGGPAVSPSPFPHPTTFPPSPRPATEEFSSRSTTISPWAAVVAVLLVAAIAASAGLFMARGGTEGASPIAAGPSEPVRPTGSASTSSAKPSTTEPTLSEPSATEPSTTREPGMTREPRALATRPESPLDQLHRYAERDRALADSLVETWVPQVSAKRPGLDVEGDQLGPYDASMVLADHEEYRRRYAAVGYDVVLVRSQDFTSFKLPDFWVTIVASSYPSPESANAWCDAEGLRPEDCFAKRLSRSNPWKGSTVPRS